MAELGQAETVGGISDQAQLVSNNMTVVRAASTALAEAPQVTVAQVEDLQRALLPDEPRHHGLRAVQNWIGSSNQSPIGAAYVPPDPERVPPLMDDLMAYLSGAAHAPLVQAAIVHAQFETIHPFTDGNGRVGRALIHTVLTRRGLTDRAVLPVSLVLATLRGTYVSGLTSYRHDAPPSSDQARAAIGAWLAMFVDAAEIAVEQSAALVGEVAALRDEWAARLAAYRTAAGLRPLPRADSATARLLALLPEAPVVTPTTLGRVLGVSLPAAGAALDEVHRAGILSRRKIARGATAYLSREILDLVAGTELALASTQFDTRLSPPRAGAPAWPTP